MGGPRIAALIVAAGRGIRAAQGSDIPKQYRSLADKPMLAHAIAAFAGHERISSIQVVIHDGDRALYDAVTRSCGGPLLAAVTGGATRQETVAAGLAALQGSRPDWVLIHDAAPPLADRRVIDRGLEALQKRPGAIAALPVPETL